eukprot:CAMPEP_0173455846 /NCGR_PEP_ID=MMETSP1357-20121228/54998_1 /TAXON_ID=77926 /ORGANISM="Hemiselmis rufescens, Strain PCC563" /LENGTH=410 /DNA_ID=CAMNT_0014423009 /DNA_START=6 /DNA_END=1238 /DNA_ORIENTATION=-
MSGGGEGGGGERVKVVVISGPTAVGKSALAERLALSLPQGGEIISADSVQVYRGMDIGSNKPTPEERASVPYHLIDVCDPAQEYTAADFADQARLAILDVHSRGKLPIVVGGTGFYLQWLVYGRPQAPAPTPEATKKADAEADSFQGDWARALTRVQEVDAAYSETLAQNDWFRLKRCLEVFYTSGRPLSSFDRPMGKKLTFSQVPSALDTSEFDFRCFFLYRPRLELFRDIDMRCEVMLQRGFLEEVKRLVDEGALRPGPTEGPGSEGGERAAERSIGYRQALDLVWELREGGDKDESGDEAVRLFIEGFQAASRQFVKRQLTWFRSDPTFRWLPAGSDDVIMNESMMPQDEFHALYQDEQEQQANRQSEATKEAQRALKCYVAARSIYTSPDARKALVDAVLAQRVQG